MVWFARRFLIGAQTRFLLIGSTLRPNKFFPARQQCLWAPAAGDRPRNLVESRGPPGIVGLKLVPASGRGCMLKKLQGNSPAKDSI